MTGIAYRNSCRGRCNTQEEYVTLTVHQKKALKTDAILNKWRKQHQFPP